MQISHCMKRKVISIGAAATIAEAADLLSQSRVGMLPVVDDAHRLLGVIQMRGLLALIMPDFVRLVEAFDFVHDFGALEAKRPTAETIGRAVREVMVPPISVDETCGLLRAFALLRQYDLNDLPVVDQAGRLVGIASRVDIGSALLSQWDAPLSEGQL